MLTLLLWCVLVGLDWAEPMMHLNLHVTCSCILTLLVLSFDIKTAWYFSDYLSLSLPLTLVASWHLNISLLHPRIIFVLRHLFLLLHLTPLPLMSSFVIRRPNRTSWKTFHNAAFIWNAKSLCQNFLTLTYPLSSIVGVGSHFVASQSCVLPWSYKNSTPICTDLITLYLNFLLMFGVYAW